MAPDRIQKLIRLKKVKDVVVYFSYSISSDSPF